MKREQWRSVYRRIKKKKQEEGGCAGDIALRDESKLVEDPFVTTENVLLRLRSSPATRSIRRCTVAVEVAVAAGSTVTYIPLMQWKKEIKCEARGRNPIDSFLHLEDARC